MKAEWSHNQVKDEEQSFDSEGHPLQSYDESKRAVGLPEKFKVFIAVLQCGWITTELGIRMFELLHDSRFVVKWFHINRKGTENAHNEAVRLFLRTDYDYLLILGDDTPPPSDYLDLVLLDKPVICGICWQWRVDHLLHLAKKFDPKQDAYYAIPVHEYDGLVEIDAIGSAGMLIKREVLEKVKQPFLPEYNEEGTIYRGCDFAFCKKVKDAGFSIWVHTGYQICHYTEVNLKQLNKYLQQANPQIMQKKGEIIE